MVQKKYMIMVLFGLSISTGVCGQSFIKQGSSKKQTSKQLKQEAVEELQSVLKKTTDMIASLTELQKELINKIEEIVVCPAGSFFEQAKQSDWQKYATKVVHLHEQVDTVCGNQVHWIGGITHNFQGV